MGDSASAASAAVDSLSMTHSTPPPPANAAEQSTDLATPLESLYTPALDSSLDMTCTSVSRGRTKRVSPLQKMNEFLKVYMKQNFFFATFIRFVCIDYEKKREIS